MGCTQLLPQYPWFQGFRQDWKSNFELIITVYYSSINNSNASFMRKMAGLAWWTIMCGKRQGFEPHSLYRGFNQRIIGEGNPVRGLPLNRTCDKSVEIKSAALCELHKNGNEMGCNGYGDVLKWLGKATICALTLHWWEIFSLESRKILPHYRTCMCCRESFSKCSARVRGWRNSGNGKEICFCVR